MSELVAVVPVRAGSQRIKNKNFRDFAGGESLLSLKLKQLKAANCFDRIVVTSDSEDAARSADAAGVEHQVREPYFASSEVRWSDVIAHVAETIEGDDPTLAWCHTTSPLFDRYDEAIAAYRAALEQGKDSLAAVRGFNEFVLKDDRPLNYNWGPWHDYSQDLGQMWEITGALFVMRRELMMRYRYVMGIKPALFTTTKLEAVDVDDPFDFALAQVLFERRSEFEALQT